MAERMELDVPNYVELEASPGKVQRRHAMLAHLASLDLAIERGDPSLVSTTMREKILAWHRLQMAQAPNP